MSFRSNLFNSTYYTRNLLSFNRFVNLHGKLLEKVKYYMPRTMCYLNVFVLFNINICLFIRFVYWKILILWMKLFILQTLPFSGYFTDNCHSWHELITLEIKQHLKIRIVKNTHSVFYYYNIIDSFHLCVFLSHFTFLL